MINNKKTLKKVEPPLPHGVAVAKLLSGATPVNEGSNSSVVLEKTTFGYKEEEVVSRKGYDIELPDGRIIQDLTPQMLERDVSRKLVEKIETRKSKERHHPYNVRIIVSKETLAGANN